MDNSLRNTLYEKLDTGFTKKDLDLLVFRLGIEEILDNSSQKTLIKELITYLEKRDMKQLPQVIKICQEINDTVDWSEIELVLNKSEQVELPRVILPELNNTVKTSKPARSWLVRLVSAISLVVLGVIAIWLFINPSANNSTQPNENTKKLEQAEANRIEAENRSKAEADKAEAERLKRLKVEAEKAEVEKQLQAAKDKEQKRLKAEAEQKKPFTVFRDVLKDGTQAPEMVILPAGKFMMGSNEGNDNEKPVHEVTVESFAIGKYEVTVGEFKAFVNAQNYTTEAKQGDGCYVWDGKAWGEKPEFNWKNLGFAQTDTHPVTCVSWNDAVAYTNWLSQQTGKKYRLPTEAEWEYAARAGTQSKWHFGNDEDQLKNYAWYGKNSGNHMHPVGQKQPNQFGLYDMAGNVWEWTCSDYEKYGSYGSGQETICSENTNKIKSLRGGSWYSYAGYCLAAFRNVDSPSYRGLNIGFRLILFSR